MRDSSYSFSPYQQHHSDFSHNYNTTLPPEDKVIGMLAQSSATHELSVNETPHTFTACIPFYFL